MFSKENTYKLTSHSKLNYPLLPHPSINYIFSESKTNNSLFLGDLKCASNIELLHKNNINSVLTLMGTSQISYKKNEIKNHKTVFFLDVDEFLIGSVFEECFKFIDETLKVGSVFIHCQAGISRSPTIVIAYLMWKRNLSFQNAFNFVRKQRNIILPNKGFRKQLRNYEKFLQSNIYRFSQ